MQLRKRSNYHRNASFLDGGGGDWNFTFAGAKGSFESSAFIIARDYETVSIDDEGNRKKKTVKQFKSFISPVHFYVWSNGITEKNFYEMISGHVFQKPYFDIDIQMTDAIKEFGESNVILNVEESVKEFAHGVANLLKSDSFMTFSSNASTSIKKLSYHIVIDSVHLNSHVENKNLVYLVQSKIKSKITPFVDIQVYKSLQQFRLLGSGKLGTQRVKTFREDLSSYLHYSNMGTFMSSLITYIPSDCHEVKIKIPDFTSSKRFIHYSSSSSSPTESINFNPDAVFETVLLKLKLPLNLFSIRDVIYEKNTIILDRKGATYCIGCKSTHSNENPFISVMSQNTFVFNCRRGSKLKVVGGGDGCGGEVDGISPPTKPQPSSSSSTKKEGGGVNKKLIVGDHQSSSGCKRLRKRRCASDCFSLATTNDDVANIMLKMRSEGS